jgi:ankyrin repeat protein
MGDDYSHEHEDRRIEKAEGKFMDMISEAHRKQLRSDLPEIVLPTRYFEGMLTFTDPNHSELADEKVPKKQKRPTNNTSLGRDASPLILSIENRQLDYARELLSADKDYLNFINTEGDTAITKAFAAKDFELVMLILRREAYPVKLATLQRVTDKKQNSPLERAVALGRSEILRELAGYGPGNRTPLEMNTKSCRGRTPLYYAIQCFYEAATGDSLISGFMDTLGTADEIMSGIDCLIDDIGVSLDVPNDHDHTALTLCSGLGLTDLAIKLLSRNANPNHRIRGGGTALCYAIENDDIRLTAALLEFNADYTLYVDYLGRPIYTMPMSDRLRDLIAYRL